MKSCIKCGAVKPIQEFRVDRRKRDGCTNECKACALASLRAWRDSNRDKARAISKRWNAKNTEKLRAASRKFAAENPEKMAAAKREYRQRNPHVPRAHSAAREAAKLRATPAWANGFFIAQAYELARLRTKATGSLWHVDHIVPLRSRLVCGLHCEANIRVIPASLNCSKNNRHWPDMPTNQEER